MKGASMNTYNKLIQKIKEANTAYYDNDDPIMSDYEYDALMNELKKMEKESPELITPDSPTQKVGGTASKSSFKKVKHVVPMLSLQDVFSENDIVEFVRRHPKEAFCVEEKIDGLSMSVTYKNGKLIKAETRGDGYIGEDITENAKHIDGVPISLNVPLNAVDELEVRCEVYLPVSEFLRINKTLEDTDKKLFANPRNAAAGILRTKDVSVVKNARLSAFTFNVQRVKTNDTVCNFGEEHIRDLNLLDNLGFKTVNRMYAFSENDVLDAVQKIGTSRDGLPYWIDGAVIKLNSIKSRAILGETSKYPRWAIAFKYPPEEKETVVRDIILQTGRTGRITPVAVFDPVYLAGTKVEKATLHNPEMINKLGINIGDTVLVRKAAEIIPEVVRVMNKRYPETSTASPNTYDIFSHTCPSCKGKIVPGADENGNNQSGAYCVNPECPAQISRRFEFWASRDCMDIRGLGPAQIDKFIKLGWLKTIPDIYKLKNHKEEMLTLDGFGKKSIDNLLSSIEKSKEQDIDRLIKALGIVGVGRHIGKAVAREYSDMDVFSRCSEYELSQIEGVGDLSSMYIFEYFNGVNGSEHEEMLLELEKLGVNMKSKSYNKTPFDEKSAFCLGLNFVITGSFSSFKRNEISELIEKEGGKVSGSVSKKTDYLICGEAPGSKLEKAKELGIKVLNEEDFKKEFKEILK